MVGVPDEPVGGGRWGSREINREVVEGWYRMGWRRACKTGEGEVKRRRGEGSERQVGAG